MRIGITFHLRSDLPAAWRAPATEDRAEEFDHPETIEAIREVLAGEGHEVFLLGGDLGIIEKIKRLGIEFVFNIAEGFQGRGRESHIPAVLEMMGIPYSGSDPVGLGVTLDKSLAKRIAISLGVPTPEFWILNRHCEEAVRPTRLRVRQSRAKQSQPEIAIRGTGGAGASVLAAKRPVPRNDELKFPLFVKPLWQGSSKGIRRSSRVEDREALGKELERLFENYPEDPVLVEEYIPGREFTVGVLGNARPEILGVMEIRFRDPAREDFCYSLEVKRNWKEEVNYLWPPPLDRRICEGMEGATLQLFKAFGLRDVARFDFRLNPKGEFYFLETNPLPGLSPESGDLVILAQKKGWSYRELILKITGAAMSRYRDGEGSIFNQTVTKGRKDEK